MTDSEFLQWIHDLLVFRFGESKGDNHVTRLRKIIEKMKAEEKSIKMTQREREMFKEMREKMMMRRKPIVQYMTGNDERTVLGDMW